MHSPTVSIFAKRRSGSNALRAALADRVSFSDVWKHGLVGSREDRAIVLVKNPAAQVRSEWLYRLPSYLHGAFCRGKKFGTEFFDHLPYTLYSRAFDGWCHAYAYWLDALDDPLVVRYIDLLVLPRLTFKWIGDYLGIEHYDLTLPGARIDPGEETFVNTGSAFDASVYTEALWEDWYSKREKRWFIEYAERWEPLLRRLQYDPLFTTNV